MEACPLPDRPPGELFQTEIPDRPLAPIHARRGPALDLKQATAAVFYALARGWLAAAGLDPEEEQNEHIQSEATGIEYVLVRETERSRAIISASIAFH